MKLKNVISLLQNNWETLLLIILCVIVFSIGIKKPFIGHHDWNGVQYGNIARNYLRYGFLKTKFGQVENSGPIDSGFSYNTHHPVFFPVLTAVSFKIFGISEFSARLTPIFFSILFILGLYFLGRLLFSRITSFWLAGFASVTPMFIYFGKMPVHEPLITCFSIWSVYFFAMWIKTKNRRYFKVFLITALLNGITGWPGYFLYPLITFYSLLFHKKEWKRTLWSWAILILTFSFHLLHAYILTGSFVGGGLMDILLMRINREADPIQAAIIGFSLKKYIIQEARWLTVYFTRIMVLIGGLTILASGLSLFAKRKINFDLKLIGLTFLFGLSYPAVFLNAVFIHDYLNIYFLPFFALSSGWFLNKVEKMTSKRVVFLGGLCLFLLIFLERKEFLSALLKSSMHKIGYDLGMMVNERTDFNEKVVVSAPQFAAHFSKFAYFYADRKIGFWEGSAGQFREAEENLANEYKYFITIDSMPVEKELKLELDKIGYEKNGELTFYKL